MMPDVIDPVRLSSDELLVDVLPSNGGDVYSVIDRRTGVDLLWKAPWGTGLNADDAPTSRDRWLTRTWGGWQLLLPNTGDEATEDGKTWGFHGEAGLRAWDVISTTPESLELALDLDTAPLRVRRGYRVDGPALAVETSVHNVSSRSVEFLWGEHPTFGEAFAAGAILEIDAETFHVETADSEIGMNAGDTILWPDGAELGGASLDHIPAPSPRRFLFGFLDGVGEGTYRLRNDRLGLAARLSWPRKIFPVVWLWEEIRFTDDPPWNGQAYAVGIEPHVAYPAVGMTELRRRGGHGLTLEPDASLAGTVTLRVERVDVRA